MAASMATLSAPKRNGRVVLSATAAVLAASLFLAAVPSHDAAPLAEMAAGGTVSIPRRGLLADVDVRIVEEFSAIRSCAPINILVVPSSEEDDAPFYVEIEAGNSDVIDALETVVEDGELAINFIGADFVTFMAVKVTVYAPVDALSAVEVGGVAGNIVVVGFDVSDDFEATQPSVNQGGRGTVILLVKPGSGDDDDAGIEDIAEILESATDAGLFEEDGNPLNAELRAQIIDRLIAALADGDDDSSSSTTVLPGLIDLQTNHFGAHFPHHGAGAGGGPGVLQHLVWTCGLQVVGDFVCFEGEDSQFIEVTGRARSGLPDAECLLNDPEKLAMLPGPEIRHPVPAVFSVREPTRHILF